MRRILKMLQVVDSGKDHAHHNITLWIIDLKTKKTNQMSLAITMGNQVQTDLLQCQKEVILLKERHRTMQSQLKYLQQVQLVADILNLKRALFLEMFKGIWLLLIPQFLKNECQHSLMHQAQDPTISSHVFHRVQNM